MAVIKEFTAQINNDKLTLDGFERYIGKMVRITVLDSPSDEKIGKESRVENFVKKWKGIIRKEELNETDDKLVYLLRKHS